MVLIQYGHHECVVARESELSVGGPSASAKTAGNDPARCFPLSLALDVGFPLLICLGFDRLAPVDREGLREGKGCAEVKRGRYTDEWEPEWYLESDGFPEDEGCAQGK